jgi:ABC-type branched-subunit amino acid transport system ATPase component
MTKEGSTTSAEAAVAGPEPGGDLVILDGLTVTFGGIVALDEVSFAIPDGHRLGLIGPNGAGKTTLLNAVSGLVTPQQGRVSFAGEDITRLPPQRRARRGIGRTFQQGKLFPELSVRDHVLVALASRQRRQLFLRGLGRSRPAAAGAIDREADEVLGALELQRYAGAAVGELPLGVARLVDLARGWALRPRLLLLDEISSGLAGAERDRLAELLVALNQRPDGPALVVVEHDVGFVATVCESIVALDFGRLIASGPSAEVLDDPLVREAYLGTPSEPALAEPPAAAEQPASGQAPVTVREPNRPAVVPAEPAGLGVAGLTVGYDGAPVLTDISLEVPAGATVAVLGPNGAGKTTLARVLSGMVSPWAGRLHFAGHDVTGWSTTRLARAGLMHIPDSRAIYPSLSVRDNLRMAFQRVGDRGRVDELADIACQLFPLLHSRSKVAAGSCSGGEQQMLALACSLVAPPRLLLVDELSHGLAPIVVQRIFELLESMHGRTTVVVVEQFAERALAVADWVAVLNRGRLVHQGPARDLSLDRLAELYRLGGGTDQDGPARTAST